MNIKSLYDTYRFQGFIPKKTVYPHPFKLNAVVIPLKRIQKKLIVQHVEKVTDHFMTEKLN